MDIRWSVDDPVTPLLAGIPRGQRTKVVQAIVGAALLPGDWAKLLNGTVAAHVTEAERPLSPRRNRRVVRSQPHSWRTPRNLLMHYADLEPSMTIR